jgi:hypothetical protein
MVGATVTRYVFDVGLSHSFLRAGLSRRFPSIQSQHAKWLLEHGARVSGRITDVSRNVHGSGSFGVRYVADGRAWQGTIALTETSGYYAPGETVTVIYDL